VSWRSGVAFVRGDSWRACRVLAFFPARTVCIFVATLCDRPRKFLFDGSLCLAKAIWGWCSAVLGALGDRQKEQRRMRWETAKGACATRPPKELKAPKGACARRPPKAHHSQTHLADSSKAHATPVNPQRIGGPLMQSVSTNRNLSIFDAICRRRSTAVTYSKIRSGAHRYSKISHRAPNNRLLRRHTLRALA